MVGKNEFRSELVNMSKMAVDESKFAVYHYHTRRLEEAHVLLG